MVLFNLLEWLVFSVRVVLTILEDLGGGSGDEVFCLGFFSAGLVFESEGFKFCSVGVLLLFEFSFRKDLF